MKKITILLTCLLLSEFPVNAQFLNKLKDKIQQGAERAVLDKAEQETYKLTSKAIEKMLRERFKNLALDSINFLPKDSLPPSYQFKWDYQLQVNSDDDQMLVDYFLTEGSGYFGSSAEENPEMIMVFDSNLKAFITYMENDGEKTAMAIRIPEMNYEDTDSLYQDSYTFAKTGNTKEILGYSCEEYKGEDPEYDYSLYITEDADIGFGDIFKMDPNRVPQGFNPDMISASEGLMMEMSLTNKNKKKDNSSMTCTKLERSNLVLNNNDYEFMEFAANE